MSATILSGTRLGPGNFTLYTNSTGGNVRLIFHHLFVHGQTNVDTYSTRRMVVTGGSGGIVAYPMAGSFHSLPSDFNLTQRVRIQIGKGICVQDSYIEGIGDGSREAYVGGVVRTVIWDPVYPGGARYRLAQGPQSFPTEIMLRNGQSVVFEAGKRNTTRDSAMGSPTSLYSGSLNSSVNQFIGYNATVIPEGG